MLFYSKGMLTFACKLSNELELKKKVDRIIISMDKVTVQNYYYIILFQLNLIYSHFIPYLVANSETATRGLLQK